MLRKQIIGPSAAPPAPTPGEIDIAAVAIVLVTSEDPGHPVDHAFDVHRGPGKTRWLAGEPGEQTLIIAFDVPQAIRRVVLEIEEREVARTQDLQLAVSGDGGEPLQAGFALEVAPGGAPAGVQLQPARHDLRAGGLGGGGEGVTHLRLVIRPDKGGKPCRATVTTLALW